MDQLSGMRIFARVVELGSFSKAAEDLLLSQSTVTKNVAWLEAHVGARLLNRNTRGVSLNDAGSLYYERCKGIMQQLDEADGLFRRSGTELDGTLRISASVAFGESVVAPLLLPFMRAHPRLRIDLSCEDGFVDLIARNVDLALRLGRLADSSLGGRYLGANPWVMAAAPAYLAARGGPTAPLELQQHECIVYSSVQGDAVWQLRTPRGESQAAHVRSVLRSNNLPAVLTAACAGLGIAILPRYVAERSLSEGALDQVMPGYTLPDQEIYAVYPSPKLVPRKVSTLIRYLSPHFRGEWWQRADSAVGSDLDQRIS